MGMSDCEALAALRAAVVGARALDHGQPFGVYLDDAGARQILEHCAQLDATIAGLRLQLAAVTTERDRDRALVVALTSEQEP